MDTLVETWTPRVLSILRIVAALIFIQHGTQKFFAFPAPSESGFPPGTWSLAWWQGLIELVGGGLLLVGLFTRLTAFVLAGDMAFAYWLKHGLNNLYPILNRGDLAVLFCFVFLYLAFAGGGPWSLDGILRRKS